MTQPLQIVQLPLGPVQTNCYIAADPATREAVIIDPAWDAPRLLGVLAEHEWQTRAVLLTHAHFDHLGAAAEVVAATGAPFGAHPLELPMLRNGGGAALFGLNVPDCPEPDWLLEPGQPVIAGSVRFDVLFVPGHTPGHVAFYHAAAQVVFSGDVLFQQGIGRTDLPGGDYATLMGSIREVLLALPPETTVCPGHGSVTTIGSERRDNPFLAD
ncbi:MAG: MBL fold metallo-hydrolase [Anaerolineales bacterium]|nr:MBL fold metallo-hydrolase [Anaerolineales bacterium]